MKITEINFYRNTDYKELERSYVEVQNKLKALEEKLKHE